MGQLVFYFKKFYNALVGQVVFEGQQRWLYNFLCTIYNPFLRHETTLHISVISLVLSAPNCL
jgi:hypothetical protein